MLLNLAPWPCNKQQASKQAVHSCNRNHSCLSSGILMGCNGLANLKPRKNKNPYNHERKHKRVQVFHEMSADRLLGSGTGCFISIDTGSSLPLALARCYMDTVGFAGSMVCGW